MAKQDSRILLKRSTVASTEPIAGTSSDHTDGTWANNEIYVGELFLNATDDRLWVRTSSGIKEIAIGSGQTLKGQLTITVAALKTSNTTPLSLVAGIAGKEIKCIESSVHVKYASTPYGTNVDLGIRNVGASVDQMENTGVLGASADIISAFGHVSGGASANVITGAGLEVYTKTGDPSTGDSEVVIDFTYIIRNIP